MSEIAIVTYHENSNGKSTKLFSVESNGKTTLEHDIAEMLLVLERKININPMLISKYILVSKGRQNDFVEAVNCILHPEDFKLKEKNIPSIESKLCNEQGKRGIIGCD